MGGQQVIQFSLIIHQKKFQSSSWGARVVKELLEIWLANEVINHEDGIKLSSAWPAALDQATWLC